MSSHHIVRDDQEPAVFIKDLDASTTPLVFSLLEWSPIVITTHTKVDHLLSLDIKIDVIFVEDNSAFEEEKMSSQQDFYNVINYEGNVLEAVLKWLKFKKHFALNYCTLKLTPEELFVWEKQKSISTIVTFESSKKILLSKTTTFEKWLPKGSELTFNTEIKNYTNLKKVDSLSYIVKENGLVTVNHNEPLFVSESLNINFDY